MRARRDKQKNPETRHSRVVVTAMPDWLRRMLEAAGVIDENGLSRRARIRRHPRCGLPVMAGLDADKAALSAWLDLAELSAHGEVAALLDGRRTFELWPAGEGRFEIERRDRWRIAGRPAGAPRSKPVLCEHRCGAPVPSDWTQPRIPAPVREVIPW